MKERTILFLLLVVAHLLSASKPTKIGSKIAKHHPKMKVRKSKSVAGHLVRTNKEKTYLAKGSKRIDMNKEGENRNRHRKYEEEDNRKGPRKYEEKNKSSGPREYEKEDDKNGTRKYEEGDFLSRPRKYEERDKKSRPRNYEKDYNINGPRKYGEEDNINGPRKYGEKENIKGPRKYEEGDNINGPSKYGNYLPDSPSTFTFNIGAITVHPSPRQCIVSMSEIGSGGPEFGPESLGSIFDLGRCLLCQKVIIPLPAHIIIS